MFGKKHSKEAKEKMRVLRIGKKHSPETIEKMKIKRKGRKPSLGKRWKLSIETRRRMSKSLIGNKRNLNKKFTEEHKRKIGLSQKGKIITKEHRLAIKRKRARQILPVKDTSIEIKVQNFLKQLGIEFATHQYMKIKYGYQCDIFIPVQEGINQKTIIECDGDYWHGNLGMFSIDKMRQKTKEQRCLDYERTKQLAAKGYRVLRIWENEINKMSLNEFNKQLMEIRLR